LSCLTGNLLKPYHENLPDFILIIPTATSSYNWPSPPTNKLKQKILIAFDLACFKVVEVELVYELRNKPVNFSILYWFPTQNQSNDPHKN
jgi:hypothetical protein